MGTSPLLPQTLDLLFPYIVFVYGAVVLFTLEFGPIRRLGERVLPFEIWQKFRAHSVLAWMSLVVGAVWILQNMWFE